MNTEERCYGSYGDIMTVDEVSQLLGISRQYVYRLIHEKVLFAIKLGVGMKIPKSAVVALIEGHEFDE